MGNCRRPRAAFNKHECGDEAPRECGDRGDQKRNPAPARHRPKRRSSPPPRAPKNSHRAIQPLAQRTRERGERPGDRRAPEQVIHHARLRVGRVRVAKTETLGPGSQRSPEHNVYPDNQKHHHARGKEQQVDPLLMRGRGSKRAYARQRILALPDREDLGSDEEEPATAETHHAVPDQWESPRRCVELPKPLPPREPHRPRRLVEVPRLRDERLVERERHVPHLAGEDREHGGAFQAEHRAGEQGDPQRQGYRKEAENRNGLQYIEDGDHDPLGAPHTGGNRRIHKRKNNGKGKRDKHSQQRPCGIVGQLRRVGRDRGRRATPGRTGRQNQWRPARRPRTQRRGQQR